MEVVAARGGAVSAPAPADMLPDAAVDGLTFVGMNNDQRLLRNLDKGRRCVRNNMDMCVGW
jgi:hypothetical protein